MSDEFVRVIVPNEGATPDTYKKIAVDTVDGIEYQRVKLDLGGDGASTPVVSVLPIADGLAVARGLITGQTAFRLFGANQAVPTSESVISLTGTFWQPTVAATLEAISTSVNDTAAGTGARTITVEGLDSNFNALSATITMNGNAATSATASSFIRVHRAYVATTGTYAGNNEGAITVRVIGAGATAQTIALGRGQTQHSGYTVPAGYTLYVEDIHISVSATRAVTIFFYQAQNADDVTTPFSAKRLVNEFDFVNGPVDFNYDTAPMAFSAKTDLWFTGLVASSTGEASVEYVGVLIAA